MTVAAFQNAVKVMSYYLHVSLLETCKSYSLCPTGLNIRKKPFFEFESDDLIVFWKETLLNAENYLLEALCVGICERMFTLERKFWDELQELHKNNPEEDMRNWLIKLHVHLEKRLEKISKNIKNLRKLSGNYVIQNNVSTRFQDHLDLFFIIPQLLLMKDVVNLCRCNLTNNEISLLSKGRNFVPTARGTW